MVVSFGQFPTLIMSATGVSITSKFAPLHLFHIEILVSFGACISVMFEHSAKESSPIVKHSLNVIIPDRPVRLNALLPIAVMLPKLIVLKDLDSAKADDPILVQLLGSVTVVKLGHLYNASEENCVNVLPVKSIDCTPVSLKAPTPKLDRWGILNEPVIPVQALKQLSPKLVILWKSEDVKDRFLLATKHSEPIDVTLPKLIEVNAKHLLKACESILVHVLGSVTVVNCSHDLKHSCLICVIDVALKSTVCKFVF